MEITKEPKNDNISSGIPIVSKTGPNVIKPLSSENIIFGTSPINPLKKTTSMEYKAHVTNHRILLGWVEKIRQHCKPARVHWCNGSQEEYDQLCNDLVNSGTFLRLKESATRGPNCFLARYIF
jgi:hypothetical protein